jgi:hypothetical protein
MFYVNLCCIIFWLFLLCCNCTLVGIGDLFLFLTQIVSSLNAELVSGIVSWTKRNIYSLLTLIFKIFLLSAFCRCCSNRSPLLKESQMLPCFLAWIAVSLFVLGDSLLDLPRYHLYPVSTGTYNYCNPIGYDFCVKRLGLIHICVWQCSTSTNST